MRIKEIEGTTELFVSTNPGHVYLSVFSRPWPDKAVIGAIINLKPFQAQKLALELARLSATFLPIQDAEPLGSDW